MIAHTAASLLIKDKRDYYDTMVRNYWHLPAFKSRICTTAFLREIRMGVTYCPKKDVIRAHTCAESPSRLVLQAALVTVVFESARLIQD